MLFIVHIKGETINQNINTYWTINQNNNTVNWTEGQYYDTYQSLLSLLTIKVVHIKKSILGQGKRLNSNPKYILECTGQWYSERQGFSACICINMHNINIFGFQESETSAMEHVS